MANKTTLSDPHYDLIQQDVITLVESSRKTAASQINALMTATYREIGRRIVETILQGADRATYGEALIQRPGGSEKVHVNRAHQSLNGKTREFFTSAVLSRCTLLNHYSWRSHCNGLFQTPIAA